MWNELRSHHSLRNPDLEWNQAEPTYESVPARMIAGDTHPDHDTLCAFRRNNLALINAGVDPGEHGLQPQETAPDGGDGLKGKLDAGILWPCPRQFPVRAVGIFCRVVKLGDP